MTLADLEDFVEYEAVDLADKYGLGDTAYDTIESGKKTAKAAADEFEKVLTWAPWFIGGALAIGAAVVLGPYVLPFVQAWAKK